MQRDDLIEAGELLAEGLDAVAGMAQETHEAVANRAFLIPGPAGRPVQQIHDAIAGGVYRAVRAGLRGGMRAGTRAYAGSIRSDAPALADRAGGAVALGAINGFVGDLLAERGSHLKIGMQLRAMTPTGQPPGREILTTPEDLAHAHPDATSRLAVFIHGLCETELAWRGLPLSRTAERAPSFPERLAADTDMTPLLVRYDSGLHISANAERLDALLQQIVAGWPVPVTEITLIGHSMGGLIARGAAHIAGTREFGDHAGDAYAPTAPSLARGRDELDDTRSHDAHGTTSPAGLHAGAPRAGAWSGRLKHVVCLGSPHLGADLERGVHLLAWALGKAPESRAFAQLLWLRSDGIKDLRDGAALEADWSGLDPDALIARRCADVPFLPHADYCWLSAEITDGVAGHLLGDLLVRTPSASGVGRAREIPFDIDNGATIHGLTHFDLLDHPAVYEQLLEWLTRPRRLVASTSA